MSLKLVSILDVPGLKDDIIKFYLPLIHAMDLRKGEVEMQHFVITIGGKNVTAYDKSAKILYEIESDDLKSCIKFASAMRLYDSLDDESLGYITGKRMSDKGSRLGAISMRVEMDRKPGPAVVVTNHKTRTKMIYYCDGTVMGGKYNES